MFQNFQIIDTINDKIFIKMLIKRGQFANWLQSDRELQKTFGLISRYLCDFGYYGY